MRLLLCLRPLSNQPLTFVYICRESFLYHSDCWGFFNDLRMLNISSLYHHYFWLLISTSHRINGRTYPINALNPASLSIRTFGGWWTDIE